MSMVRSPQLTYKGLDLLAKGQLGNTIHFTRVLMGDGEIGESQDIRQLEGLVSPKLELPIKDMTITGVGTVVMEAELKNNKLQYGFFAKEIGIFAKDGEDGEEILYSYRNTGADSEYIPAGGGSEVWNLLYDVITVIDQAENVTAEINGDVAYVTKLDFKEHCDSATPHPNFAKIGDEVETTNYFNCGLSKAGGKIDHISIDSARKIILGDVSTPSA